MPDEPSRWFDIDKLQEILGQEYQITECQRLFLDQMVTAGPHTVVHPRSGMRGFCGGPGKCRLCDGPESPPPENIDP